MLAKRVVSNKCYKAVFVIVLVVVFALTIWDLVTSLTNWNYIHIDVHFFFYYPYYYYY